MKDWIIEQFANLMDDPVKIHTTAAKIWMHRIRQIEESEEIEVLHAVKELIDERLTTLDPRTGGVVDAEFTEET